jgi:hypothetical protein
MTNEPSSHSSAANERIPPKWLLRLTLIDRCFDLGMALIKWGGRVAIAYVAYLCVDTLAGKSTLASFLVSILAPKENNILLWICIPVALGAIAWGSIERYLRQQKTKYLTERNAMLEKRIDPNRTSSGLMPTGDTNPEDAR